AARPAGLAAAARRDRRRGLGGAPPPRAALSARAGEKPPNMKFSVNATLLCLMVLAPGCDRAAAERSGVQLAARVNGTGISVREVRALGEPGVGPAVAGAALER